uniref:Uncharacterized protein LOC108050756 n=1 Tax=Drosophila rhopaloa TaxID=1041015 RepID=A0A6P4FSH7_DRORH
MPRLHIIPRKQDYDKRLVELYSRKKFVAESLTSVYASHTTVSPNGLMNTDSVSGIEDRHLTATPDLPSLLERSSMSQNKNLYNLSLQLLDQDGYESDCSGEIRRTRHEANGQDSVHQIAQKNARAYIRNQMERITAENIDEGQGGNCRERSPSVPIMRESRKKDIVKTKSKKKKKECAGKVVAPLNFKPFRQLSRKIPQSNASLCAEPVITVTKQPQIQETLQKTVDNTQTAEVHPHLVELAEDPFMYSENPKKTLRAIFEKAERSTSRKQMISAEEKPNILTRKNRKETLENVNVREILKAWALDHIQFVLKLIDDNHIYSLLFLLATIVYLAYILCYDVSEYLNEERRYLAKIQSSGLPMKCFYYLMRLLRAPIF